MKIDTDNLHVIFLLKKNIQQDIIKTILGYLPIVAPEMLKEQKVAIISVEQKYEFTEEQCDYKTGTRMIYGERRQLMDIGKSNNNFKDRKLKCFNCNKYDHIAKDCWKKKEKETRKCFKCDKEEYIVKGYKGKQSMKKQKVKKELDDEDNKEDDKKKSFSKDLEQA